MKNTLLFVASCVLSSCALIHPTRSAHLKWTDPSGAVIETSYEGDTVEGKGSWSAEIDPKTGKLKTYLRSTDELENWAEVAKTELAAQQAALLTVLKVVGAALPTPLPLGPSPP